MNFHIRPFAIVITVLIAGCSGPHSVAPSPSSPGGVHNHVFQNNKVPINWTQFPAAPGFGTIQSVVAGPDKNVWFGNYNGGLMQVTMAGKATLFPLTFPCNGSLQCNFNPSAGATVGKDKNMYFGGVNFDQNTNKYVIGVVTTAGVLTAHDIPSGDNNGLGGLALGPDGNVWFTEQSHIGRITTAGTIKEFLYPSGASSNQFGSVTAGPDGNVWFTENGNNIVGQINPTTFAITEFPLASQGITCNPSSIVAASDGNIYFICDGVHIGQMTKGGVARLFYNAYGASVYPDAMAVGPDGNPWWATGNGAYLTEFIPSLFAFRTYVPPYSSGTIAEIAAGPDKNIWAAESDNKIDVYITAPLTSSPASVKFTGIGQTQNLTISEAGTSSWKATSTDPTICTVAQGNQADIFVVTAVATGTTRITVKDAIGNSIHVPCKVP